MFWIILTILAYIGTSIFLLGFCMIGGFEHTNWNYTLVKILNCIVVIYIFPIALIYLIFNKF